MEREEEQKQENNGGPRQPSNEVDSPPQMIDTAMSGASNADKDAGKSVVKTEEDEDESLLVPKELVGVSHNLLVSQ